MSRPGKPGFWFVAMAAVLCWLTPAMGEDVGRTRVTVVNGQWHLDGTITYPGSAAEGLLMNVRMVILRPIPRVTRCGTRIAAPSSPPPPSGYTLPSAGAELLLHNGDPPYGRGAPPSFAPLMRLTSVVIDRAGNVWAVNNWKPSFDADLLNSGGDGICIFVGLAKPPVKRS
jgi:hypothetical protein